MAQIIKRPNGFYIEKIDRGDTPQAPYNPYSDYTELGPFKTNEEATQRAKDMKIKIGNSFQNGRLKAEQYLNERAGSVGVKFKNAKKCEECGTQIGKDIGRDEYTIKDHMTGEKEIVCEKCYKSKG